jgi:hypothetical protein
MRSREVPVPAYALLWNPDKWNWRTFEKEVAYLKAGGEPRLHVWTCKTKRIRKGDRIFLFRTGPSLPGVIGSGVAAGPVRRGTEYDGSSRPTPVVPVAFDALVDPRSQPFLPRTELLRALPYHWRFQKSGCVIPSALLPELETLWAERTGRAASPDSEDAEFPEGEERRSFVAHRVRERKLRSEKLAAFRATHGGRLCCEVPGCGLDFDQRFGRLGEACAEVHHLRPLSEVTGIRKTKLTELAVVCSNHHRLIHAGGANRRLAEVAQMSHQP